MLVSRAVPNQIAILMSEADARILAYGLRTLAEQYKRLDPAAQEYAKLWRRISEDITTELKRT